jgi:hypothetical protein
MTISISQHRCSQGDACASETGNRGVAARCDALFLPLPRTPRKSRRGVCVCVWRPLAMVPGARAPASPEPTRHKRHGHGLTGPSRPAGTRSPLEDTMTQFDESPSPVPPPTGQGPLPLRCTPHAARPAPAPAPADDKKCCHESITCGYEMLSRSG